jgi:hypothetical protein
MTEFNEPGKNWRTILTLALSTLGILFFLGQALLLGVVWLITLFDPQTGMPEGISIGLLAWSSIMSGFLLLPVLLMSVYRLRSQSIPGWLDTSRPAFGRVVRWLILGWPVIVFLGWLVADRPSLAIFLLGPINLLVAGLPVLWIYYVAQRRLEGGSQMQKWRIFGFSLTIIPIMVIVAEVIAILILVGIGGVWFAYRVALNPQIERQLMHIVNQIALAGEDLDAILQLLEPYILQPSVIFWAMAIFGGIMPIIEELIKPLALWSLAGRNISPGEGFVGGLICGAGFALMENVLYFTTITMAEDWLFMAIGRAGTGVLHMLATGLVGWGLAKAWRHGNWLFFGTTTLGAILLHGLWNALALVSGVAPLYVVGPEMTLWQTVLFNSPVIFLLVFSAIGMFWINRHLRTQENLNDETNAGIIADHKITAED